MFKRGYDSRQVSQSEIRREKAVAEFARYYDAKWTPMHEYFGLHRRRFLESFEFLDPFVAPHAVIADLVQPGDGPGPLAESFSLTKKASLFLITTDLREPFDLPDLTCDLVVCTETIEHIKDKDSSRITDLERFNYSGVNKCSRKSKEFLNKAGRSSSQLQTHRLMRIFTSGLWENCHT